MSAPGQRVLAPNREGLKFGPYWLEPGIRPLNAVTLLFSGLSLIGFLTFMSAAQPLVLKDILAIPEATHGRIIGWLGTMQEAVLLLTAGLLGALSDKVGRRIIYVVGLLILSLAIFAYPLAGSLPELFAVRFVYAFGFAAAAVMAHTCFAAYSQDVTRGKWMGLVGVLNGVGVLFMAFVIARVPKWFGELGYSPAESVRNTLWLMALYFVVLAVLIRLGLESKGTAAGKSQDNVLQLAAQGFAAARANPRITLAYGMAFASRGDLVVLATFFFLWFVHTGTDMGMDSRAATARAGMYFGLSQGVALVWAFTMGVILDRINRMTGMCIAFGLAGLGYLALGLVADPFGSWIVPAAVLVGIGEGSAIISAGVLIGQEAPAKIRGAVLGTFSVVGAAGIMFIVFSGGYVFDHLGRTAPFLLMAAVNFCVFLGALMVRSPRTRAAPALDMTAKKPE